MVVVYNCSGSSLIQPLNLLASLTEKVSCRSRHRRSSSSWPVPRNERPPFHSTGANSYIKANTYTHNSGSDSNSKAYSNTNSKAFYVTFSITNAEANSYSYTHTDASLARR